MNIFYLHDDPREAARMQCDKHVVKMILESAQMLSTAHRILDGEETIRRSDKGRRLKYWEHPKAEYEEILYKPTHVNHPSNVWVRESRGNYTWLLQHFYGLCKEYTFRYGRTHASETKLAEILWETPINIEPHSETPIKLAMPDQFKSSNLVRSYRDYYTSKQSDVSMVWTKRETPEWFNVA